MSDLSSKICYYLRQEIYHNLDDKISLDTSDEIWKRIKQQNPLWTTGNIEISRLLRRHIMESTSK